MEHARQFYIDGQWVDPLSTATADVINPATERAIATIAMGGQADVDAAVSAARAAFDGYSQTTREERLALLDRIIAVYAERSDELGAVISAEVGAPLWMARRVQAPTGKTHFEIARRVLSEYQFERPIGTTQVVREPVGVVGLITPWNWPLNQIACKVAPALAAGCTMILKPSEVAPLNAVIFAEILDEAGVPPGVFNLVHGDGQTVGAAICSHPEVDMVSFTGSTRAGIEVAKNAAPTVKRVAQELGGKSANIMLDDVDFTTAVSRDVKALCLNSGQTCSAPTRMLVPLSRIDEAAAIAAATVSKITVGDPSDDGSRMGPVVSEAQYNRIQALIGTGISEGAQLEVGGLGRPDGIDIGFYVRPTVFSHVTNEMTIVREEIFGPVLVIIGYDDEDDAVRIANDSNYGLSGYVSGDPDRAKAIARRIRTGSIAVNGAPGSFEAPFGGYKQSGNGREWGEHGMEEFLEIKAILGYNA